MIESALQQLKTDKRYTTAYKLWYSKYPFRVSFKRWDMFDGNWVDMYKRYRDIREFLRLDGHSFKYRNDSSFFLYLESVDAVTSLIERDDIDFYIDTIEGPITTQQSEMMLDDFSIAMRKKLYYNRYRYKVSTKQYFREMDFFLEFAEFITETFDPENYYLNNVLRQYPRWKAHDEAVAKNPQSGWSRFKWTPYSATGTVYLHEYDDVCTLHLMYKNQLTSTNKVVLIEELE